MSDDQTKDKFELIKFTDSDVFVDGVDGEGFCLFYRRNHKNLVRLL